MPSYLDFDSTKKFRDFIIGKTLNQPNGPQTFTKDTYDFQKLSSFSNSNPGDVIKNDVMDSVETLSRLQSGNIYKELKLYPLFPTNVPDYNLVGIMGNTAGYQFESELFKFAASNIQKNPQGPVLSRISSNINKATLGRVRLLDALNGNTSTAINLLTGREPLIEFNNSITVAKTLPGKAIDFLQTAAGVTAPFSEIPGDYLNNPLRPTNIRPEAKTQLGKILQDATGALGSMIGIQRRPTQERKPSDLMVEYMGQGPKQSLFNSLEFNTYAPNYTRTARSQNTSKLFNFVDRVAQGFNNLLGVDAPVGKAYIGDDRGDNVMAATIDAYDRPFRSNYYLTLMFDKTAAELFHRNKNYTEGGGVSGNLTWISKNSKNKLGANNVEYSSSEQSLLQDSLSTKFGFRDGSILSKTQEILDSMPTDGGASRSHVANVIDQTSRVFMDGDVKISRGSAIKYTDKYNSDEAGVEYCRVWTKDRGYLNFSDTMKRKSNHRKFDSSVMGGASSPFNLNIAPMSNGKRDFAGSTNIFSGYTYGGGFYAKKYMFSIENLAWKTSNRDGFRVTDLPACERGPNGGRVMWFPPYDLKVSEQNNARWEETSFLGRPEPIYTYQNTARTGQVSFKVVVDHPSILNLMTQELFKGMKEEESDNFINAFFAGCKDLDFYEILKTYTTLDESDVTLILLYLNSSLPPDIVTIKRYTPTLIPPPADVPFKKGDLVSPTETPVDYKGRLYFDNDFPSSADTQGLIATQPYGTLYETYNSNKFKRILETDKDLRELLNPNIYPIGSVNGDTDKQTIFGTKNPTKDKTVDQIISIQTGLTMSGFTELQTSYDTFKTTAETLKSDIDAGKVKEVTFTVTTTTSEVAEVNYNFWLGVRRGYSIVDDLFTKISNGSKPDLKSKWFKFDKLKQYVKSKTPVEKLSFKFSEFGYKNEGVLNIEFQTQGETATLEKGGAGQSNLKCGSKILTKKGLKITAPIAFFCRQAEVAIKYDRVPKPSEGKTEEGVVKGEPSIKIKESIEEIEIQRERKPTINVMQRIIAKMLSECFYFKKLEEDSPLAFKSLTEKLKYFHPAFHSTTPEGLNSRLTFLLQCVRPGDTIPIKGINDSTDLGARNSSFGPPPICVLRVGDFYHSKVVIRDVNISYDENVWDLNPEGIGVQPMIATVSLQIAFIGGQGLDKPIEQLQNALSSNFFGNTEMYDERSKITSTIDGQNSEKFTKAFLEDIKKRPQNALKFQSNSEASLNLKKGEYIGGNGETLRYSELVDNVHTRTEQFINSFKNNYESLNDKYGSKVASVFVASKYRKINKFDITVNGGTNSQITLLGEYEGINDLSKYSRGFKGAMVSKIRTSNFIDIFGLKRIVPDNLSNDVNEIFKTDIESLIIETIDGFVTNQSIIDVVKSRNLLLESLNKVNFLTKIGFDGKISDTSYFLGTLQGFSTTTLYNEFSGATEYIKTEFPKLENVIDSSSIDFEKPIINDSIFSEILSIFLNKRLDMTLTLIAGATLNGVNMDKVKNKIDKFFSVPDKVKWKKISKTPVRSSSKKIEYTVTEDSLLNPTIIGEINKLWGVENKLGTTLNYFK
jgi:hypothetical protein